MANGGRENRSCNAISLFVGQYLPGFRQTPTQEYVVPKSMPMQGPSMIVLPPLFLSVWQCGVTEQRSGTSSCYEVERNRAGVFGVAVYVVGNT
jgi:hypothetical protein